ncbi:hypothetical protein [Paenibacillus qinlingensis]|uniref:Uncharacterized protein n=1 Tax=Paenibacillus qinlingensis TaxID=1837343 RepID=A0ABU1NRQ9_9BACL|nr:hypothetical protein [Paenibacillus qinlingensis]MDR6550133.1 hypothetical protein [Paenibacillus qinlingensis]
MINKDYYFSLCKDAESNQVSYIEKAKSKAHRWEYTDWKRYDSTPYWFERNLEPRAPLMEIGAGIAYAFDENNNICFISASQEECFEQTDKHVINRRYWNGKVDSIEEIRIVDGLPVMYVEFIVRNGMNPGQEWHFEEEYAYENRMLVKIKRTEYWYAGKTVRNREFQLEYDHLGNLSLIKENGAVIYNNLSSEQIIELRAEIVNGLIAESIHTIKKIGEKLRNDSVCFIGIYLHDEPQGPIDPIFHPGLQSIRDKQLLAGEDTWTLWSAGEHPVQYQESLSNEQLKNQFTLLMQYWQIHSDWSQEPQHPVLSNYTWWGESKALWQEVAMELNLINWESMIRTSESFVIFADEEAMDVASGDLAKNVPANKLHILERMGLLSS